VNGRSKQARKAYGNVGDGSASCQGGELFAELGVVVGAGGALLVGNEAPDEAEHELGVHVGKVLGLDGDAQPGGLGRVEGEREVGQLVRGVLGQRGEAPHLHVQRAPHNVTQRHPVLQIKHQIRQRRLPALAQMRVAPSKKRLQKTEKKEKREKKKKIAAFPLFSTLLTFPCNTSAWRLAESIAASCDTNKKKKKKKGRECLETTWR
jgi:hypothetical protein